MTAPLKAYFEILTCNINTVSDFIQTVLDCIVGMCLKATTEWRIRQRAYKYKSGINGLIQRRK